MVRILPPPAHSLRLAKTTVTGMAVRQKTLILANTTTSVLSNTVGAQQAGQVEFYSLNATAGFSYSLKTTDVLRITKVSLQGRKHRVCEDGDLWPQPPMSPVSFHLTTDNATTPTNIVVLIAGPLASTVLRPTGRMLVIFDWFQHSGRGYASVDSYLSNQNVTNGLTYDTIPDVCLNEVRPPHQSS
jgi:hypothetical protein